jgi:PGF-pre-PGF domain-containing protein
MNKGVRKRLKSLLFVFVILTIFIIFLFILIKAENSENPSPSEWRMFRRYLNHTAYDGSTFAVPSGLNYSTFVTGGNIRSSPAIVNGYVYIGSDDGNLYQLNASNISQKIANRTIGDEVVSSPAIANGFVYVGTDSLLFSGRYNVYQLNASDVSLPVVNYSATTDYNVHSSPAVANGSVYIGGYDHYVYQMNASNISIKIANYSTTIEGGTHPITSSPAVANGFVYIGGGSGENDSNLWQLNASNVSIKVANYTVALSAAAVASSPAVWSYYVYITGNGNIYQLNATNVSKKIASSQIGADVSSPAIATIGSNTYLYIGGYFYSNYLYQLNASNVSQTISNFSTEGLMHSSPTVADGYVYVGSDDGYMYQLNASNVSLFIGKTYLGSPIETSPAYAKGYLYIAAGDNVYQINASNLSLFTIVDNTPPTVNILTPYPSTQIVWPQSTVPIVIDLNELGYCEYSVDGGITNYTLFPNVYGASSATSWSGGTNILSNGGYTFYAYCNDTSGNRNDTTTVNFTVYYIPSTPEEETPPLSTTIGTGSVPSIPAGESTTVTITNSNIEVNSVTISTTENVSSVSVTVTEVPKTKVGDFVIGVSAGGAGIYQALNITARGLNNSQIESASITFRVNISWVEEQRKATEEDIHLFRRNEITNKWEALNTTYLYNDSQFYYYSAVTPGFSTFVIYFGRYECEPGINRCFENQIQMCLGNATWLVTEKCAYGCDEQGVCLEKPLSNFDLKILYFVVGVVVFVLIVVFLLRRVPVGKNKSSREVRAGLHHRQSFHRQG